MKKWQIALTAASLVISSTLSHATVVPQGTAVTLVFKQNLSSKNAKAGDRVMLAVARDVRVGGSVVLHAGTPVTGVIEKVSKRGVFGKNGSIRLTLTPVDGITLQPRTKGNELKGSRTDHAAEASGAGLLILGPVGLIGGVFIKGKNVEIHEGAKLETDVSRTVNVH